MVVYIWSLGGSICISKFASSGRGQSIFRSSHLNGQLPVSENVRKTGRVLLEERERERRVY